MAITAALTATQSSVQSGQKVGFVLVLSNSGGADVTVTDVITSSTGAANKSTPRFTPSSSTTIPAGGTLTVSWEASFFAGAQATQASFACAVSATVYTSDGSVTTPANTCTVQVTAPTLYRPWVLGQPRFDALQDSYMLAVI